MIDVLLILNTLQLSTPRALRLTELAGWEGSGESLILFLSYNINLYQLKIWYD